MRRLAVALFLLLPSSAAAQTTNLELFQEMAVECLGALPSGTDTLSIEAPDRMPYLRSALIHHLQDAGRTVYLADSTIFRLPRLSYEVEQASVGYARRGRQLERRLELDLRYTYAGENGLVIADDRCRATRTGLLSRAEMQRVQDPAYPETQADLPPAGIFRRYVEPVVLTAATAVAVYLFFTLRSSAGD